MSIKLDTLDDKTQRDIIGAFMSAFPRIKEAAPFLQVAEADLAKKLLAAGLNETDLDDDYVFRFSDFRDAFKESPIASVRKAYRALRGGKDGEEKAHTGKGLDERTEQLRAIGLKVRVDDASSETLLGLYIPDRPNDPVTNALKKRFGVTPIIAFREDGTLAKAEILQYISDIEQNYPKQETLVVDGKLTKLWPIGVKPDQMVDEDPLFPGQPLRNEYSVVNNRNWSKVGRETRKLCRIIVDRGDIDVNNNEAVLRLLERAKADETVSTQSPIPASLLEAYPEAELEFRERKKRDELPKLKIALGSNVKPNNPFGSKRSY